MMTNQENMISQKLRVLLAERGIKVSTLAERTGLSKTSISLITRGKSKNIGFGTIDKVCTALRVTPAELFTPINGENK